MFFKSIKFNPVKLFSFKMLQKNSSAEETLICSILFSNSSYDVRDLQNINYEKLVYVLSSHLITVSFYIKLKKKEYLNFFEKDFIDYLKKIYESNNTQNKKLLSEVLEISNFLNENKINYVFIKGASHILSDIYSEFSERMVSDIDVLVDKNHVNKIVSTFKSNGYNYNDSITFKSHRHLTPLVKKNKIFPVEIHTRPLNILNFKYLTVKQMITNKLIKKNSFVPSYENQFYLNIYNFLINDFGYHTLSYNYKNIYDTFLINKKMKSKIVGNRFIIFYAKLYSILTKETISNKEIKKSFSLKFYLVSKFKILFYLNLFFFKINNTFRNRTRQIFEILNNKKYRIFLFKKLK